MDRNEMHHGWNTMVGVSRRINLNNNQMLPSLRVRPELDASCGRLFRGQGSSACKRLTLTTHLEARKRLYERQKEGARFGAKHNHYHRKLETLNPWTLTLFLTCTRLSSHMWMIMFSVTQEPHNSQPCDPYHTERCVLMNSFGQE